MNSTAHQMSLQNNIIGCISASNKHHIAETDQDNDANSLVLCLFNLNSNVHLSQYLSKLFKANCIFPASSDTKAVSSVIIRPFMHSLKTSFSYNKRKEIGYKYIKEYRTQWTPLPHTFVPIKLVRISIRCSNICSSLTMHVH